MNLLMLINKEIDMNKKIIKTVSLLFGFSLLILLYVFFPGTEQKVASINNFLNGNYYLFLVIRFVIYTFLICLLIKFKITIKTKVNSQLFFRTSKLCFFLICFNEIMLFIRMG